MGFDHYSSTQVLKHASRVSQPRSGFTTPPGPFGIQDPQGWNPVCLAVFFGVISKPTWKTIQENGTNWAVIKKFVGMCEKSEGLILAFGLGSGLC